MMLNAAHYTVSEQSVPIVSLAFFKNL